MSGANGPLFSSSGQCLGPSIDGIIQHGPQSAGIQGDPNASTPNLSPQPGTHGASDAEWNATLIGNHQGIVGCSSRPNVVGRDLVGTGRGPPTREANREASHVQTNQRNGFGGQSYTDGNSNCRPAPEASCIGSVDLADGVHDSGDDAGDAPHNQRRTRSSIRRDRMRLQLARENRDRNTNDNQDAGAGGSTNGASDARGSGHAVDTPNGASDARIDPNGASDANCAPDANLDNTPAEVHFPYEVNGANGATDACNNPNGAPDANGAPVTSSETPAMAQAAVGTVNGATDANTDYGAPDAIQGHNHGRPGRRTRGGARTRRRSNRGSIPNGHDGHVWERGDGEVRPPPPPQHPPPDTSQALIDRIIGSLPYLSTLSTRQIGSHTWSDQLVPLIWCATRDSTCEQLREALTAAGRGHEALTAFRSWWIGQGIYTPEDAVHILNIIARQLGVRGPPIRRYQYLQAPIQEHLATPSGAEFVVASDLVRTQQTNEGPRTDDAPVAPVGVNARNSDTTRSVNADRRLSTSLRDDEEAEIDNSRSIDRPRYALEQFRPEAPHVEQGNTTRSMTMTRIQECIVWLTCSRNGAEQAEQVLTYHQQCRHSNQQGDA